MASHLRTTATSQLAHRKSIVSAPHVSARPAVGAVATTISAAVARSSGETSTSGASGAAGAPGRRRVVIRMEAPGLNWDRRELMWYKRLQERGELDVGDEADEGEEEAGGAEAEEAAAGGAGGEGFARRLDRSDLSAAYFQRWDDPAAHQPMLQDRVLTAAWREALAPGSLEGKVVLDVGCGLGLLSMLAAKAGAAKVIAVDGSAGSIEAARRIVKANGLAGKIELVHGAIESLDQLPGVAPGEVDVVLSNWMGPGLLAGGMANGLAVAVERWLRPGGMVLPDRVSLWAAGLEDRDALQDAKESWSRVGGLDMSAALAQVIKHPRRDVLTRKTQLLTAPQRLAEWRTRELTPASVLGPDGEAYARCPLSLTAVREERLFGLVLWWEAAWTLGGAREGEGKSPVRFTTHPLSAVTHFQQLMLNLPKSMRLQADDELTGEVVLRPGSTDPRDLELGVSVSHAGAPPVAADYRVSWIH
ncbi:hypothetical protein HYH03_005302 [Edaphochlamys debaryana]|uniref:Methyltransferase domain-containing protein n=1 Tax=Edaphochlamys debaryana TaxID=47281 RepID=A0A835Y933_9CHLO|nr:hypothetical protein HYH03_005302 [Edaphochlamys debaryana]|eukprot:KAG2496476.1 hypothetical protein HYH03_005302 [Edaphochlamys debaryana]